MKRECLAVGIILLFVGVAVSPGITSSIANDKTVQFNVELCGLNQNYSVQLTSKQAQEVYATFDVAKQKLSMVKTQAETKDIFSEAINKLHIIGLLGDVEVSQVIDLVAQPKMSSGFVHNFQTILTSSNHISDKGNYLCSIAGNISNAYFCGTSVRMLNILMSLPFFVFYKFEIGLQKRIDKLLSIFYKIVAPIIDFLHRFIDSYTLFILHLFLISFLATIATPFAIVFYLLLLIATAWTNIPTALMFIYEDKDWVSNTVMIGNDRWGPSVGWVNTVGKNGNVNWNGSLWGQLPLLPQVLSTPQLDSLLFFYPGIVGFKGIKVWVSGRQDWSILGNALWVNLGSDHPRSPWLPTILK